MGDSRKNAVYNRRRNGRQNYQILKCYENEWLLIMRDGTMDYIEITVPQYPFAYPVRVVRHIQFTVENETTAEMERFLKRNHKMERFLKRNYKNETLFETQLDRMRSF